MVFYLYVNDSWNWYGLGISLKAAMMAQGRRPRVIMVTQRSIPWPYHYKLKQPLTYIIKWLLGLP